jgi:hypothetical protein
MKGIFSVLALLGDHTARLRSMLSRDADDPEALDSVQEAA